MVVSRILAATASVIPRRFDTTGTVVPHAQISLTQPYVFWATSKCASSELGAGLVMALVVGGTAVASTMGKIFLLVVFLDGMVVVSSGLLENEISVGVASVDFGCARTDKRSLYVADCSSSDTESTKYDAGVIISLC